MSQKLKIVTIGGGSSYTPELLEGFLKRYHELPITELWLVDVAEGQEKLDIIHALCQRMVEKAGVPMKPDSIRRPRPSDLTAHLFPVPTSVDARS